LEEEAVKRTLPAYVYAKGRKGYLYYCRRGAKPIRMHETPGTAEFAAEYAMLLRGRQPTPARTVAKLVDHYMASPKWAKLAANTRKSYGRHATYFVDVMGSVDPAKLRRVHINEMRDALSDTPTDANRKVGFLSTLLEHAIDIGWIKENPAHGVRRLEGKRPPRQPWPGDVIEAYRAIATGRPLLLFEMLLGTGQRIGDVLRMQWAHIEDDGIRVKQGKTGAGLWVPLTDRLRSLLSEQPRRSLYIVAQANGRPVSYQLAWHEVMDIRRAIGAERWDIHGLRHSAASEIAAIPGMTAEHVMAITGHSATEMVRLYAGAAQQKARATEAQKGRK
jgi:integrase